MDRRKSKSGLIDRANTISWIPSVSVDDRKEEICAGLREEGRRTRLLRYQSIRCNNNIWKTLDVTRGL